MKKHERWQFNVLNVLLALLGILMTISLVSNDSAQLACWAVNTVVNISLTCLMSFTSLTHVLYVLQRGLESMLLFNSVELIDPDIFHRYYANYSNSESRKMSTVNCPCWGHVSCLFCFVLHFRGAVTTDVKSSMSFLNKRKHLWQSRLSPREF